VRQFVKGAADLTPGPLSSFAATPLVERGSRKELLFWLPLSTQRSGAGEGGGG